MKKIILASQSPRRRELLKMIGMDFEAIPSDCDENISAENPGDLVEKLSLLKCGSVADGLCSGIIRPDDPSDEGYIVIGSDTIVVLDGEILGKPADEADAFLTLKRLKNNTHTVFTGVSIRDTSTGKVKTFHEETKVTFFDVSDEEIKNYVATKDPLDKAGSYGVQGIGAFLVKKIEGDYFTVVGLPVGRLFHEIQDFVKFSTKSVD